MVERILPEGKELVVEPDIVEPLIRAALYAALNDFRGVPVQSRLTTVYRSTADGGVRGSELEVPEYFRVFPEGLNPARSSAAAQALTDYLWSRGQLKKKLSRDDAAEPTKEAWAAFTWDEVVLRTIWYLAGRAASHDISTGRAHELWRADPADVEDAVTELVGLLTGGHIVLTAICPLTAWSFPDEGNPLEVEPGVSLEPWRGGPNQTVFLTRFQSEFLSDDRVFWLTHAALVIRIKIPGSSDAVEVVAAILDRFKWAVMVVHGRDTAPIEGATVLRSATRHVRTVLRRESDTAFAQAGSKKIGWTEARSWQGFRAEPGVLGKVKDLLASLARATAMTDDLGYAVWAFGRACVASTPRDSLLEATIGLERLLVRAKSGETTYRFRLHGAAILFEEENAFKELGDIYDLRSTAAHGGTRESKGKKTVGDGQDPFQTIAPRARFLLAKTVHSIVLMLNRGEIILGPDGKIANAIEDLVRRRAATVPIS